MTVKISKLLTLAAFALTSVAALSAAPMTISYVSTPGTFGVFTVLNPTPATNSPDTFTASITSPQFGAGTVSVLNDFTNYVASTGHANLALFTFSGGTFSGSADSVLNLANGTAVITYTINAGTGTFAGVGGQITEYAHFVSQGNPANVVIDSATGFIPEPGTVLSLGLGLLGLAGLRRCKNARS